MAIKEYRTSRSVIATDYGARIPYHGTIDLTKITPDSSGTYAIPAGLGWHRSVDGDNSTIIPAKLANLSASLAAGATSFMVDHGFASVFSAGDVIVTADDVASLTLSGTYDGTEVLTVTVGGVANTFDLNTSAPGALDLNSVAGFVAKQLNGLSVVDAVADGPTVYLFADAGSAVALAAAVAGGTGAVVANAAATAQIVVGTVSTIDVDTGTITPAAPVADALPPGAHVGVETQFEVIGFTVSEFDPATNRGNVGLWTSGTLSKGDFPFSRAYANAFPEIRLV